MSGKGDKRRKENYSSILENWDKIFSCDDFDLKHVINRACHHCISNKSTICKFCGKSKGEILSLGESYYED